MARILFVHQNFPGQFPHLARALCRQGHDCRFIAADSAPGLEGITSIRYRPPVDAKQLSCHPWAKDLATKAIRGECVARLLINLVKSGWTPDLIIGHPGWGELLVVKDILPNVPVWHQMEFFYSLNGADYNFDPEFRQNDWFSSSQLRLRRAPQLLALEDLDCAVAPTKWQASTAPDVYKNRIHVIHEGIDTNKIVPKSDSIIRLRRAGLTFKLGDPVVTFVARNLEPYRGFHIFMRSLPLLQSIIPDCHVIIVGDDGVSYGRRPKGARSWKAALLKELEGNLDFSRIHFAGKISHEYLHNLFQVSACHVYLTYPFVLSWSLLEAMSCGCLIVGSQTEPLEEVVDDNSNGFLVNFFDADGLANRIAYVLKNQTHLVEMRLAARRTVQESYDLNKICLPRQIELASELLN